MKTRVPALINPCFNNHLCPPPNLLKKQRNRSFNCTAFVNSVTLYNFDIMNFVSASQGKAPRSVIRLRKTSRSVVASYSGSDSYGDMPAAGEFPFS